MDAKELRIGNIIDIDGKQTIVLGLIQASYGYPVFIQCGNIYTPYRYDIKYASPIPLTEEWLLKFGWYKDGSYFSHEDSYFELENHGNKFAFCIIDSENWCVHYFGHHEFVHEHQNLFYSLNKKELTIKQ